MKSALLSATSHVVTLRGSVPLFFGLALLPALAFGQGNYLPYTITTFAGAASPGSADGIRSRARFSAPGGLAIDAAGNLYVADTGNATIRKIAPDGAVTTIAGIAGAEGSADGVGSAARFNQPGAVAIDGSGTIYVADTANHTIRKIAPDGTVSTVAGSAGNSGSADGTGADARFNGPQGVAVDSTGSVYVADTDNDTIRRITPGGAVTTVAGLPGSFGDTDGVGSAARFTRPAGLAVDAAGNIYIGQSHSGSVGAIRKVTPGGEVTTLAEVGAYPAGLAVDAAGGVYMAVSVYSTIDRIARGGSQARLAGSLAAGGQGNSDGLGYAASFRFPSGIAVDAAGTIYVADTLNNTIRKGVPPDASANVLWAAGNNADGELGDGSMTDRATPVAIRAGVRGVAAGQSHSLLVTDDGTFSTAGANAYGQLGDGTTVARNTFTRVSDYGVAAAGGASHSLFLWQGGSLRTSGRNNYGQLGDGTTTDRASPVLINRTSDPFSSIQAVAAGADHTLFLASDGTLWGMGYNGYGQLGAAAGSIVTAPVQIASGVRAMAAGGEHSLFIKTDGTLWGMGYNRLGQLGDGTGADRATPVPIAADVWQVAAGYHVSLFVKTDGTLWGMGESASGELGGMYGDVTTPIRIATGVRSVSTGQHHTLFIKTDGTLWAMGDNHYGQLGDGTTAAQLVPIQIADHVRTVAAGFQHSLFVVDDSIDGTLPSITAQPADQTVTTGQSATFYVAFDSTSPAVCHWQRRTRDSAAWVDLRDDAIANGTIDGSAGPSITINTASAADGDSFRCVITNVNGLVTSEPAILSVVNGGQLAVVTLAGQDLLRGSTDGTGSAARFNAPADVAADAAGNVYVADTSNHVIRKITSAGAVTTLAGLAGANGSADGAGAAARFNHPAGVAVDGSGNVYVADTENDTLRRITPAGAVTTLAGQPGLAGSADGATGAARFNGPSGVVVGGDGDVYVADTLNHVIRRISPAGLVTTLAGRAGSWGSDDGTGSAARFFGPQALAIDALGGLYVADTNNSTIRRIVLATGTVTTIAGQAGQPGYGDGPAARARFRYPSGVAVDRSANLFVADTDNNALREITPAGAVSTAAGRAGKLGSGLDGVGSTATFNHPTAVSIGAGGRLFIADTDDNTIRAADLAAAPTITAQPQSQAVTAGANVTFSVSVTGQPAPTFQWNFNGSAVSGATSSTLSMTNVQSANAGSYTITVTNATGSVTSNAATLTVNTAATPPPSAGSGGSGGGGAPSLWFLAAMLMLALARAREARRCSASGPTAAAPAPLSFNR